MNDKAVIFDLDGVLIDSMPFHYQAWKDAFAEFDIDITREDIYEREGEKREKTVSDLYSKYSRKELNPDLIKSIIQTKDAIYKRIFKVQFIPGALELLASLKRNNVKLALVTGATSLEDLFRQHTGFLDNFDAIVDGDSSQRGKPAPDPYLIAVQRLQLSAENCCVIENAPLGIMSAVAANLICFAIKGPSSLSEATLKAAGAHRVYEDIEGLKEDIFRYLFEGDQALIPG